MTEIKKTAKEKFLNMKLKSMMTGTNFVSLMPSAHDFLHMHDHDHSDCGSDCGHDHHNHSHHGADESVDSSE